MEGNFFCLLLEPNGLFGREGRRAPPGAAAVMKGEAERGEERRCK